MLIITEAIVCMSETKVQSKFRSITDISFIIVQYEFIRDLLPLKLLKYEHHPTSLQKSCGIKYKRLPKGEC